MKIIKSITKQNTVAKENIVPFRSEISKPCKTVHFYYHEVVLSLGIGTLEIY